MKKIFLLVFVASFLISCASIREKRAANNQPFKPHENKKAQQHHPKHR